MVLLIYYFFQGEQFLQRNNQNFSRFALIAGGTPAVPAVSSPFFSKRIFILSSVLRLLSPVSCLLLSSSVFPSSSRSFRSLTTLQQTVVPQLSRLQLRLLRVHESRP